MCAQNPAAVSALSMLNVNEPVGYSTIAYNVTIPPKAFDSHTIADANPCYRAAPPFPDLDPRTAGEGKKTVLQLSRVTVVLDETGLSGGKGNGSMFVRLCHLSPLPICRS